MRVGVALLLAALVLGLLSWMVNPAPIDGLTFAAFFAACLGLLLVEVSVSPEMPEHEEPASPSA